MGASEALQLFMIELFSVYYIIMLYIIIVLMLHLSVGTWMHGLFLSKIDLQESDNHNNRTLFHCAYLLARVMTLSYLFPLPTL